MTNITQYDFEELKRFFDQNDTYNGADFLSDLISRNVITGDGYNNNYTRSGAPQGLVQHDFHDSSGKMVKGIGIDPDILNKIHSLPYGGDLEETKDKLVVLEDQMRDILAMHQEGADHIPTIISTREQLEEIKDQIEGEDEVLIKTSYDRAMEILR